MTETFLTVAGLAWAWRRTSEQSTVPSAVLSRIVAHTNHFQPAANIFLFTSHALSDAETL